MIGQNVIECCGARWDGRMLTNCPKCGRLLTEPSGSVDLLALQLAIECNLEKIERVLGPNYKLTLIGKYHGAIPFKDADIILTKDTRENILSVLNRFFPPS